MALVHFKKWQCHYSVSYFPSCHFLLPCRPLMLNKSSIATADLKRHRFPVATGSTRIISKTLRAVPTRAMYNRFQSADSSRGNTIGGQILNMFNTESRPTLQRIGGRFSIIVYMWVWGLYYPHTDTPIVEESALESMLESADYSSKSADSHVDSPKIGLWVWGIKAVGAACVPLTMKCEPLNITGPPGVSVSICDWVG